MTTWYVRPDTSHSETRDGTSYATAWGGWPSIIWGGAGVSAGDTLYVCGAHPITASAAVGNHGATADNRVTISGGYAPDPGSIRVSATSSVFVQISRSYTTLTDLTITANSSNCIYMFGTLTGITIRRCTLNGGTGAPIINISGGNGYSYKDLHIDDNDFIGGSGSSMGSAVNWFVGASGTPLSTLDGVNITNNRFTGCSSARAVVNFRIEDNANTSSKMADIVAADNSFTGCYAAAMEIYGPSVYGRNTGIWVLRNTIRNQRAVGSIGGGFSIGGFGLSLTPSFGQNIIAGNKGYVVDGPTGLVNIFFGTYIVYNNYGEDLSTPTIDANGILFDHGCDNCVAYSNEFHRVPGKEGVSNSGCGIMVLDATNCRAYGNIVDGCKHGIFVGNKLGAQSSDIHNNTFSNCAESGIHILSTADRPANLARNNLFTTKSSKVPSVKVSGDAWAGESNNAFSGFGAAASHTHHPTDIAVDPLLDSQYRPRNSAVIRRGVYLGGKDFYGKQFYEQPNIGAVDDETATPRYLLRNP